MSMGNKITTAYPTAAVAIKDVGLDDIPTWQSYFETNEEKLINCLPSKGGDFEWDKDINERVSIYKGDITCLEVDGIVSASNSDLIATGGVSARIVEVAGSQLEDELLNMNGCETGKAKVTSGYQLPAKYVIHAVGPEHEDTTGSLLESCYKSCLTHMQLNHMKSLAFCCISTGSFGYAQYKAVLIALKTVRNWLEELKQNSKLSEIDRIVFCLYTSGDLILYESWMQVFFPCCPTTEMDLLPLPGYVRITVTEPDMLGLDDSRRQAKMPCGHVIGPDSITEHCRDILRRGGFQFICPSADDCNAQWEYFIVRHVARLTPQELTEFEQKIAENYLMRGKGMHRCPGCSTWCYRAPGVGAAVRCPLCTAKHGTNFDFCWWCDQKWLTSSSTPPCGNPGCDGTDKRLHILATCPTKLIDNCPDCPSIRGCPSCGILIEHIQDCGHMACSNCPGYGFCFICLKETVDGEWQCAPYMGTCKLVPRQTTLPGSQ